MNSTEATHYCCVEAAERINHSQEPIYPIKTQEGKYARDNSGKAETFAKHLENHSAHILTNSSCNGNPTNILLNEPHRLDL